MSGREVWTIGHSNRGLDDFLTVLRSHGIGLLADVRRFPGSRRLPHFGAGALEAPLGAAGIGYRHFPGLGGRRRHRLENSPNNGWRVESFRAYADYMQSQEFAESLAELESQAATRRTAIMCSEAVPWRCHRRLVADALLVRGWSPLDIFGEGRAEPHRLTDFARVSGVTLTYPGSPSADG